MTLMECVMALAVIAFVLPVVMLVLSAANGGGRSVMMQGEARRAILSHVEDVGGEGLREGGDRVIWAHTASGDCLGVVDDVFYEEGLRLHHGQTVRYLIVAELSVSPASALKPLSLRLEHPASAGADHRKWIEVHSRYLP